MARSTRELEERRFNAWAATRQSTIAGCFAAVFALMSKLVPYIGAQPLPVLDRILEGVGYLCLGSALALFLLAAIKRTQRQALDRALAERTDRN